MKAAYGVFAVLAVVMLASTATAVQYVQQERCDVMVAERQIDVAASIMSCPEFQQVQQIVDENFPHEYDQYVEDTVRQRFSEIMPDIPDDPFLYPFVIIAEAVMLLLGHNLVGETAAMLLVALAAIPISLVTGVFVSFVIDLDEVATIVAELVVNWDEVIVQFGLLGAAVIAIAAVVIIIALAVIGIPLNIMVGIGACYIYAIQEMFNYIFGGTVLADDKASVAEQPSVMSESEGSMKQMRMRVAS